MGTHETQRLLETHETNDDSLVSDRLMETNGDSRNSRRLLETHESNADS